MISPIETYNGVMFKRDDLYRPFTDIPLNGGKLRQMMNLIETNLETIRKKHNSTIITYTSVISPQALIVARVAREYGLRCLIVIGGTKNLDKTIQTNAFLRQSRELGAEFIVGSGMAYNNVLYSKTLELNHTYHAFIIKFGIDTTDYETAVIQPISEQVQNIPDCDNLIIPVGSAICTKGIIKGVLDYKKKVKNIFCVQISGYDRSDVVDIFVEKLFQQRDMYTCCHVKADKRSDQQMDTHEFISTFSGSSEPEFTYRFIVDKTYPYATLVERKFNETEYLDMRYEAKAYDFYLRNKHLFTGSTLFWIIGNNCKNEKTKG